MVVSALECFVCFSLQVSTIGFPDNSPPEKKASFSACCCLYSNHVVKPVENAADRWQILKASQALSLGTGTAVGSVAWAQNRLDFTDAHVKPAF